MYSSRIRKLGRVWASELSPTLALAMPIMAGMVGQMLMGMADTIMVGRVGMIPLAAASLVNTVAHLPLVFAIGLVSSVSVLTAQAYGARRPNEAGEVLRHGLLLTAGVGVGIALVLAWLRDYLHWLGQPPDVVEAAGVYLVLVGSSLLPAVMAHAAKQFSEALNRPWTPTFILLGSVILNILLNWILIYGHWGAPALGLEGAGWATLIARFGLVIAMVSFVVKATSLRTFQPDRWLAVIDGAKVRRLWEVGWPVAMQHLLEVSAFALAGLMMGWISARALAAHQIAITCAATTFMFPLGIGMAICIRVGHMWGSKRYSRMRRIGFIGLGMSVAVMGPFALLFIVAGELIARIFIETPAVIGLTASLLFVAAFFQIVDGLQVVAISALRGLTDVRVPAVIAVLAYWIIAVPMGYMLAFVYDFGAVGIWIGLAIGLGTAATGLSWRFHRQSLIRPGSF